MASPLQPAILLVAQVSDLQSLQIPRGPRQKPKRKRSNWPLRGFALALAAALVWLFWPDLQRLIDGVRLPQVKVQLLRLEDPAAAAAVSGTAANGHVVAARRAALSSDVPGRIVEMNVTEGSVVQRGDVVARLYADEFKAALDRAKADADAARATAVAAQANLDAVVLAERQAGDTRASLTAQLAEAAANRDFAASEFARATDLAASGSGSPKDVDRTCSDLDAAKARVQSLEAQQRGADNAIAAAKARVAVARAQLLTAEAQARVAEAAQAQAQAALDKTDVRAPFDGVVVLKDAEVGEVVSPNVVGGSTARGAVCTMVDFDSLEVQATVPETNLASVHLGGDVDVFLDARPDHRYPGKVDRIWPTADRQKATIEVRIKLLQKDAVLRPEMGVRAVFRPEQQEPPTVAEAAGPLLLVAEAALLQQDGKLGAFVVDRDQARFVPVQIGERRLGRAVVEQGLRAGMRVVLDPPTSLHDGDRVRLLAGQENP